MKVSVVGLGKVGLPLALVLAKHGGHDVVGYDLARERVLSRLEDPADRGEAGLGDLIATAQLRVVQDMAEVVEHAEVVFVVVQTLHGEGYGGEVPMPDEPADFDYTQLREACGAIWAAVHDQRKDVTVAVVSTVLPGTIHRELGGPAIRLANDEQVRVRYVYNPALISLGTVVRDLLHPDFVLIGADDHHAAEQVAEVWVKASGTPPFHFTSIESAELLKVALNAWLSTKIAFANTLAQLSHATGADVDEVTDGLKLSAKALGPFGLTAGLGDGGPCRPRDVIALDWLACQADTTGDNPFRFLARQREDHAWWLAQLVGAEADRRALPVVQLGWTYKPGSALPDGSPARLLAWYLEERGNRPKVYDRVMFPGYWPPPPDPAVFVLAVPHPQFTGFEYPPGSVVVDAHGLVKDTDGITVIRVGRR